MEQTLLSKGDLQVLKHVFDPEGNPAKPDIQIDGTAPSDPSIPEVTFAQLRDQERSVISQVEEYELTRKGTRSSVFRHALHALDDIIDRNPSFASARNNRAQLRRWYYGENFPLYFDEETKIWRYSSAATSSINDLKACISISNRSASEGKLSPFQCRLLGQAHTQLAAIYHAASKRTAQDQRKGREVIALLEFSQETVEEAASQHFYLGGLYGNEVARALAVRANPHAKLCGSIVQEAMKIELFRKG